MYKVMIIDDEAPVRKLLRVMMDWKSLDMEVAGEAESGIEAINTIDDLRPDICFVDIRMPFMDGIEFSRLALKRYPMMKIIILTAYEEFSYARECIGIGVAEYRLKPIVKKDIMETLQNIKSILDKEDRSEKGESEPELLTGSSIQKIMEYLKHNYADADLNLSKVAQEFGFNASYLSRKIKAETGDSFVDILFRIRMGYAKDFAKAGEAMYRTAAKVGIPDPNYFSKCFKKYTDITYSDYCAGCIREAEQNRKDMAQATREARKMEGELE